LALIVIAAVLIAVPLCHHERLLPQSREPDPVYALLAVSLNLLVGYGGMVSLATPRSSGSPAIRPC